MLSRLLIIGVAFLFTTRARAQTSPLTLSGRVVSQDKEAPIPFASVTVAGRETGTLTNTQGDFTLKLFAARQGDSIQVSCVGYQSVKLALPAATGKAFVVRLKPVAVVLDEVRVQARLTTALDILREAVAAIPRNYDTTSVQLTALYREDQQFAGKPVRFSEAQMQVYKTAYNQPEAKDELKLIKGWKKEYDPAQHRLPLITNLSNGARSSLINDLLKYRTSAHKSHLLNEQNFRYYDFALRVVAGERPTYVIDFKPGKRKRRAYGQGQIYIDVQTLAFVRFDFQLSQAGLDRENNSQWLLKQIAFMVHRGTLKLTDYRQGLSYRPYEGKWYLSNVDRWLEFRLNSPSRNLIDKPWEVSTRFTVTDIGPKGIPPFGEANIAENQAPMSSLIPTQSDAQIQQPDTNQRVELTAPPAAREGTERAKVRFSNRQNGFTRADTLRGKLTALRSSYDVLFYDLAVQVAIADKAISGTSKMRFRVLTPLAKLQLDLYANMHIQQIRYAGKPLTYTREFDAVFVQFPEWLKAGSEQELEIDYSGKPQTPDFSVPMMGGFLWDKDRDGHPWVQVVCQGSGASLWWPNKDHLSDEPDSMRISVTVPDGLMAISNGRLLRKTALPNGWMRYQWGVSYPINNYNVTLNIGNYAHRRETYGPDSLTLDYYYMPYNGDRFRWVFDGVKPMLATLEKHYGRYPFPRDGFTLMESLYPMEHQSAVSFGKLPTNRADSLTAADSLSLVQLVWHEVSHEWWGNNVSCRDMADLWIHEAFATYSEGLYLQTAMRPAGELGYMASLIPQVVGREPIVGVRDVNHIHYNIGDLYAKAGLMLYTFRHALNNDTLWAAILKGIQQRFRYQTLSTQDLVAYINAQTGTDYTPFFDQYLNHTAIPTLQVQLVEKDQSLVVNYRWKADVRGFRMPVQVTQSPEKYRFITPTTDWQTLTLPNMTADDFEVDEARFYVNVEELAP